ncbi:hypothetical protein [Bradyrhizobium sp. CCBAU 45384]|uniref:hypothetical protein n=1 Tax=Bradyrhizobium sp. CCBAU 45384 TaxID=858428 RepID=UPI0023053FCA|nr:hypothetical protein [Bradyrhizobium sp. CCBAU 45384]
MVEDQRVEREERNLMQMRDRDDAGIAVRPQQRQHGGSRREPDQDPHLHEENQPRAGQHQEIQRREGQARDRLGEDT